MQISLEFLQMVMHFINNCFSLQILSGVTLGTILFYNLMLLVIFTSFARRR